MVATLAVEIGLVWAAVATGLASVVEIGPVVDAHPLVTSVIFWGSIDL